jgi:hypothetical protein
LMAKAWESRWFDLFILTGHFIKVMEVNKSCLYIVYFSLPEVGASSNMDMNRRLVGYLRSGAVLLRRSVQLQDYPSHSKRPGVYRVPLRTKCPGQNYLQRYFYQGCLLFLLSKPGFCCWDASGCTAFGKWEDKRWEKIERTPF